MQSADNQPTLDRQELPAHLAWSLEQPDVLGSILLSWVPLLYSTHQPLVHVVIHTFWVKVWVVQRLLNVILNKGSIELLLLGKVL